MCALCSKGVFKAGLDYSCSYQIGIIKQQSGSILHSNGVSIVYAIVCYTFFHFAFRCAGKSIFDVFAIFTD